MLCKHLRYKVVRTHGKKSRGYMVCKDCGNIITKKDIQNERRRRKKSFKV